MGNAAMDIVRLTDEEHHTSSIDWRGHEWPAPWPYVLGYG
jgi:hypothetical protein